MGRTEVDAGMHRRRQAGVAVLLLPVLALMMATAPLGLLGVADAAEQRLERPAADSRIEAPFEIHVRVQPAEGEVVERVDARLAGPANRSLTLTADQAVEEDGTQLWRGTIDPLDGLPLPNGAYRVEVRAVPLVGEPGPFDGHSVFLAVPPPDRDLIAEPTDDDPTQVALSWQTVPLPDFIGYRLQRRTHDADGVWATVHDVTDPRVDQIVDAVPEPGEYRYRLIVVRSDGEGGELFGASDPRGVRADPEDPGTFPAPPEPRPRPAGTSEPEPVEDAAPGDEVDDAPDGDQPSSESSDPLPVTVRPPSINTPVAPAPPAVVPFDDGVFEEVLPFEETTDEIVVIESETALVQGGMREGGTLAVLTEDPQDRRVALAGATGLLLIMISAHLRRFLAAGNRR